MNRVGSNGVEAQSILLSPLASKSWDYSIAGRHQAVQQGCILVDAVPCYSKAGC